MAKIGRNEPCPCASERKYKRCCGTPEARARIEAAAGALEEAVTLAAHFPGLRPRGDAFAAWAERAARDPDEVSIDSGIALLDEAERERILRTCAEDQPQAWRSLCADAGDTALVETALLSGAVLAGVSERCPIDAFRFAYLEHRVSAERPFEALSWVLDGNDLWSVIESAEADAALAALDDDLGDDAYDLLFEATLAFEARRLTTPWHVTRLAELVERVRASLPIAGLPGASELLATACDEFEPGGPLAEALAVELLHASLNRLRFEPAVAA